MSIITFSENHEAQLIPFEDGQSLASLRDGGNEGLQWVYSLGLIPTQSAVVVGLGAGFHIAALADLDPNLNITVVESREALIPVFRARFSHLRDRVNIVIVKEASEIFSTDAFQEAKDNRSYILTFRECWGQQVQLFMGVFSHLTGRSLESARYHLEEYGINMKALYLQPGQLVSIKELMPVVESSPLLEYRKQVFRVVNELVK